MYRSPFEPPSNRHGNRRRNVGNCFAAYQRVAEDETKLIYLDRRNCVYIFDIADGQTMVIGRNG